MLYKHILYVLYNHRNIVEENLLYNNFIRILSI